MSSGSTTSSARERLLAAADRLFYEQGVNSVGIDRVIEEAGVAKASLYSIFGSKEQLVVAYLRGRLERQREHTMSAIAKLDTPRDRILAAFDALDGLIHEPPFNGCAFINASAEAQDDSAIAQAARESLVWSRGLFTDLARDLGAANPEGLARQLVMLYYGALIAARMDQELNAALTARAAAEVLVDSVTKSRRRRQ